MEAYVDTLCLLTQPKERQQKFKNKKQPELTESLIENQTTWKPNNQGDKEETFTQTGRRGGEGQLEQRGLAATWQLVDPARWWIVEWGGQSCSWPVRQQLVDRVTDRTTQGSSAEK